MRGSKMIHTEYENYEDYLEHQKSKSYSAAWLESYDKMMMKNLYQRIKGLSFIKKGTAILCLGARLGIEVRTFDKLGCLTIGIDIKPGEENKDVLYGDFHRTKFNPESFDVVYTNSLDHSFNLNDVVSEAKRILKPQAYFIVDASLGTGEKGRKGEFESILWVCIKDLIDLIAGHGFSLVSRKAFLHPWKGEQLCLQAC